MKTWHATTAILIALTSIGGIFPAASSVAGPPSDRKPDPGRSNRATTFDGSCLLKGTVTFEPGAWVISQPLAYGFTGEGTCTGKLNGKDVEDVTVDTRQQGRSEGSCAEAHTTEPGVGALTFTNGSLLTYSLEFTYMFPETDFTWYGSEAGTATGTGTFRTDRTPPDTSARCATPEGVTEIPMDITIATDGVLVSRRH